MDSSVPDNYPTTYQEVQVKLWRYFTRQIMFRTWQFKKDRLEYFCEVQLAKRLGYDDMFRYWEEKVLP
jgi:hypothetical protein